MIKLFVGFDQREAVAYHVFVQSVIKHTTRPISVTPLALRSLRRNYCEGHTDGSNDFIYSRFIIPYLSEYKGWAIFADGDMLCRTDIDDLWALRDDKYAVQVVKHEYKTKQAEKYLGAKNEDYPRKNWSSVILFNCEHPSNACLTPEFVSAHDGAFLHRFAWLEDSEIGRLPLAWNWLVTEYNKDDEANLVHFTLGTPCFREYATCDYADEWYSELRSMLNVANEVGLTWLR